MGKIKLWITDLDGTIINSKNEISEKMFDTIQKVKAAGVKVVIATGRMFRGAKPIADYLSLDTPVVCYQGAMARLNDEIIWQASLKLNDTKEVIKFLRERNIHTNLYNNDELFVEDDDKRIMREYCQGRFVDYNVVNSLDDVEFGNVSKILAIIEDKELFLKIENEMKEKFKGRLKIVQSHNCYLEITDIEGSKGSALKFLMDYYGIEQSCVLASGDNNNDIDLLENAGIKVAMGNATEHLKAVATHVCDCVDNDGLAYALEEFVL